jgi:hypothetical protein
VRKNDILNRREIIAEFRGKRNQKIQDSDARKIQRDDALEEARKQFAETLNQELPEEEQPKFNEEEFLAKWNEENKEIEIPDDIPDDIDADFIIAEDNQA